VTLRTLRLVKLFAIVALAALVVTATALAGRGAPREKFNAADQARARTMVLRQRDLPGLDAHPGTSGGDTSFSCAALDESDLTLTGDADSPDFSGGTAFVSSEAQVYESVADGTAAWKRDTSAAGVKCLESTLRKDFAKQGLALHSFRRLAFPQVSQRASAFRLLLSGQAQGITVNVFVDVVVLLQSRAEVFLTVGSGLVPTVKAVDVRLAKVLAGRMKAAMRRG